MKKFLWISLVLSLGACQRLPPDQAQYKRAQNAYDHGDFNVALANLLPLVKNGHPAAQLLLSQMYTHGAGVPHDAGKAEMLRSLAALRLAARSLTPEQRTLAAPIAKAMIGLPDDPDARPGENASTQALENLDPAALEKLANDIESTLPDSSNNEPSAASNIEPLSPEVPSPGSVSEPSHSSSEPVAAEATSPGAPWVIPGNVRRADGMSLTLLRRSADHGDVLAMELLSAAYRRGYYGLRVDADKATRWSERAGQARSQQPADASDEDSPAPWPWIHLTVIIGAGLLLMGLGIWQARRVRPR